MRVPTKPPNDIRMHFPRPQELSHRLRRLLAPPLQNLLLERFHELRELLVILNVLGMHQRHVKPHSVRRREAERRMQIYSRRASEQTIQERERDAVVVGIYHGLVLAEDVPRELVQEQDDAQGVPGEFLAVVVAGSRCRFGHAIGQDQRRDRLGLLLRCGPGGRWRRKGVIRGAERVQRSVELGMAQLVELLLLVLVLVSPEPSLHGFFRGRGGVAGNILEPDVADARVQRGVADLTVQAERRRHDEHSADEEDEREDEIYLSFGGEVAINGGQSTDVQRLLAVLTDTIRLLFAVWGRPSVNRTLRRHDKAIFTLDRAVLWWGRYSTCKWDKIAPHLAESP